MLASSEYYNYPLDQLNTRSRNLRKLAFVAFLATMFIIANYQSEDGVFPNFGEVKIDSSEEEEEDNSMHGLDPTKYHGTYPHSLLTLFYPYTLLRDVVRIE